MDPTQPCEVSRANLQPIPIIIANPSLRLLAALYDGLLVLALMAFVGAILVGLGTSGADTHHKAAKLSSYYLHGVVFPAFIAVTWWFYGIFWRKTGQTLGMQTWHLKTMNPDGSLLNWPQAFIRCGCACLVPTTCALMSYFFHRTPAALVFSFCIGFLFNYGFAYLNQRHLAVHDLLSGTLTAKVPAPAMNLRKWWKS